jgi:hypothetical protein
MTAEVVTDISDVTERMQAAGRGLEGEAFTKARDAKPGGSRRRRAAATRPADARW